MAGASIDDLQEPVARGWTRRQSLVLCTLSGFLLMNARTARAANYPSKPVRIVVPYGPGGIADVTMRLIADDLSKRFKQRFFIENKPGAGGILGMQAGLEAPADGYTLLMIGGGLTIAKALFKHLPYDIEKDIEPISTTAQYSLLVVTKSGSPFTSIKAVVATAKAHPGEINIGTINAGSTQNLSAELFRIRSDIDVRIIPYKTTPELVNAVLRGDVQLAIEYFAGVQAQIINKQMTALATTGATRASNLPDVPTMMESGVPNYDVTSWNGLGVRAGTPAPIVKLLNLAIGDALKAPRVREFYAKAGMEARGMSPSQVRAQIKSGIIKWTEVIHKAGIKRR